MKATLNIKNPSIKSNVSCTSLSLVDFACVIAILICLPVIFSESSSLSAFSCTLSYVVGLFVCGITGYDMFHHEYGNHARISSFVKNHPGFLCLLFQCTVGFGGGLCRDIIVIHRRPWLFSREAISHILILLAGTHIIVRFRKQSQRLKKIINHITTIADWISVGEFVRIGMNACANELPSTSPIIIACSGIFTALAGGVTCTVISIVLLHSNKSIIDKKNAVYYAVIMISTLFFFSSHDEFFLSVFTCYGMSLSHILSCIASNHHRFCRLDLQKVIIISRIKAKKSKLTDFIRRRRILSTRYYFCRGKGRIVSV